MLCPQCGAVLAESADGFRMLPVKREANPPFVWHRARPEFPVPLGCRRIFVPFKGYLDVDDDTRRRVDRFCNVPMLVLALLVLPLLVVDYYASRGGQAYPWLTTGVMMAHVTISVAFLAEFLIKISISQSRFSYITRNWIDPIIIILPFLRWVRVLQSVRALRSLQAATRLYAVRGVGLKAVRTMVPVLLGLRFTQRFRQRSAPVATFKPDYSQWPRAALLLEVQRLQQRLETLERSQAADEEAPPAGANP